MDKRKSRQQKRVHPQKGFERSTLRNTFLTSKDVIIAVSLFIFAFVLYANTFWHDYVLDDKIMITENSHVQMGISGIPELISHGPLYGWRKVNDAYRPLAQTTYAVEISLFGSNPNVHHIVNVFFYALTGVFLFFLLRMLLPKFPLIVPALITFLFLAHPIHTEAVANIKSRDEIFSFLFMILSLLFLLRYISANNRSLLIVSLIMYFFSLLSKENSITFLVVVPLALYVSTQLSLQKILFFSLAYVGIAGIYLIIRWSIIDTEFFFSKIELVNNSLVAANSVSERLATAVSILGKYIMLLFLPVKLSSEYGYNQIPNVGWSDFGAIISLILCTALIVYGIIKIRKKEMLGFAILLFFITIIVVSNIFIMIGAPLAERFLYTPSLGFCIGLVLVAVQLFNIDLRNLQVDKTRLFLAAYGLLLIAYSYRTIDRNTDWHNELSLFTSAVEVSPNSMRAHWGLADTYKEMADITEYTLVMRQYLEKAISHYRRAIEIIPQICQPWHFLGYCLHALGNEDEAAAVYQRALTCDPKYPKTQNNIGLIYFQRGQYQSALKSFSEAVHLDSTYANAYGNLGGVYHTLGKFDSALINYEKALSLDPSLETFRMYATEVRKRLQK